MASFRCYDNSDVIATLITTNFHLYLIQLRWQFFQMLVYGDVVCAQTWQVLTLKNRIEPFSYASTAYVVAAALVSVRLFCKNLTNLQKFFRQMVSRPRPKIARTPMFQTNSYYLGKCKAVPLLDFLFPKWTLSVIIIISQIQRGGVFLGLHSGGCVVLLSNSGPRPCFRSIIMRHMYSFYSRW